MTIKAGRRCEIPVENEMLTTIIIVVTDGVCSETDSRVRIVVGVGESLLSRYVAVRHFIDRLGFTGELCRVVIVVDSVLVTELVCLLGLSVLEKPFQDIIH